MAGMYASQIFPRVMDHALGRTRFQEERERALAPLRGSVLEIGFGTGLNLPHYPKAVTWLTAVEPESLLPQKVALRSAEAHMPVEVVRVSAERMPFESQRFDCVLATWTLCSIEDPVAALREVRRVLKPDGLFVFVEHGRSDDPRIVKWQNRLNPLLRLIACGCNLNRPIDSLIEQAGMKILALERFIMSGVPKVAAAMYRGHASPA